MLKRFMDNGGPLVLVEVAMFGLPIIGLFVKIVIAPTP